MKGKFKTGGMILSSENKRHQVLKLVAICLMAGIVANYFFYIIQYAINFPFYDDFDAILEFVRKNSLNPVPMDRIKLLLSQHNEHRFTFSRILILAQYYLTGHINFRWLIIIGNSSLILTLLYLYKSFVYKHNYAIYYFLPVSLILFNFRYHEISFMAIASTQFPWVLLFALMSFYYLFKRDQESFCLSLFFAALATFTSGNGMMVFFAGAFVLFFDKTYTKDKKIVWIVFGLVMMSVYFIGYVKPGYHPPVLKPLLNDPLGFIEYLFAFLGSAVTENIRFAVAAGMAMVMFVLFLTLKKYYKETPVIFALIGFILASAALAALTRFGFGVNQSLDSRYSIYSTFLILCCYIAFVQFFHRKMNLLYLLGFSVMAFVFNYRNQLLYLPYEIREKEEFDVNYALVTGGKFSNFNFGWPMAENELNEYGKKYLKTSDSLGYFKFRYVEDSVLIRRIPANNEKQARFCMDETRWIPGTKTVLICGWALIEKTHSDSVTCFIRVRDSSGKALRYRLCGKNPRNDVTEKFQNDLTDYDSSGFITKVDVAELKPGQYYLDLVLIDLHNNLKVEINTAHSFVLDNNQIILK